jgi:hypothetical protein
VRGCRSLGAPLALEIQQSRVLVWPVRADSKAHDRPTVINANDVASVFHSHAGEWNPADMLRAKNILPVGPSQRDFIDYGLIPALESDLLEKLDPMLRRIFF